MSTSPATEPGREIVWQNAAPVRPGRGIDGEALVRADQHGRIIDVPVTGSDARAYANIGYPAETPGTASSAWL